LNPTKSWVRPLLLLVWSVLLTGLTGILGLAPLRAFRYSVGGLPFFLISAAITALLVLLKLQGLAAGFFIIAMMAFMMSEAEDGGFSVIGSAGVAILGGALISLFGFLMWARVIGTNWLKTLKGKFEQQLSAFLQSSIPVQSDLSVDQVFTQMPSVFLCMLVIAVALALIFEKPLFRWAGVKSSTGKNLMAFKLPDFFVWLTIGTLLITYVDLGRPQLTALGSNILNVLGVLYFFQGLAILCKYFEVFKVSGMWKSLWLLIFITQLFFVLCIIGFVDFWIDFRGYFVQKAGDILKRSKQ
jgi:hypothetical protein